MRIKNLEFRIKNVIPKALVFFFILNFSFFIFRALPARAETPEQVQQLIDERQRQIQDIEAQIAEYWKSVDEKKAKGTSVQGEIDALKAKIYESELQIKSINLTIQASGYQLKKTEAKIGTIEEQADKTRIRLGVSLRSIHAREETPLLLKFAEANTLSDIFGALAELDELNGSLKGQLDELKRTHTKLTEVRDQIAEEKQTQERLRRLEESQREVAARRKEQQAAMLKQIEKEKGKLLGTIESKKRDLQKIKEQITYLNQIGVSTEEAVRFGELAAIRSGIRAAYLIAVLEVESRLGMNVGKGNWKTDMPERDHAAFIAITSKLGLDPDTMPVSRKPSYGWGGAMGPAQFIPSTWLAYEAEVARLTGHTPPSPWNIEDAFTAAALMLARRGATAKTRAAEISASYAYISGNPNCTKSICSSYANLIQDKAADIEVELNKRS